jgi:hypothetical protein
MAKTPAGKLIEEVSLRPKFFQESKNGSRAGVSPPETPPEKQKW